MSKAAKQSILILAFLLIGSFSFLGITMVAKQRVEKENNALKKEFDQMTVREKKYITENKTLRDQLKAAEQAKNKIQTELDGVDEKIKGFTSQITQLTAKSNDWKTRVEKLQDERQKLLAELEKKPEPQVVVRYVERTPDQATTPTVEKPPARTDVSVDQGNDQYWAGILKEKASIELALENLNTELSETLVQLEEYKKDNTDLQLELSKLTTEKESIEREVKHGKDLADTLSLDLARAKSDKKFAIDQLNRIKEDNEELQDAVKKLNNTKIALEKSIVKLTEEKNDIHKKLVGTESIIQNKIEEIWQIKETLTKTADVDMDSSKEIELPPIIVSANANSGVPATEDYELGVGFDGSVVNVNNDNNFVIVDLGENDGVHVGDKFGIYRNTDYIAEIEVIQVRADISAADIKQTTSKIKVGDIVR